MKQIAIDINASWFPQAETGCDMIRGNAAYQWEYDSQWLRAHRGITLSGDLLNAGDYMLSADSVRTIVDEVCAAMKSWHDVARQCGITAAEQERYAERFEK